MHLLQCTFSTDEKRYKLPKKREYILLWNESSNKRAIQRSCCSKIIKMRRHCPLCVVFIAQLRSNRYWLIDTPIKMRAKINKKKTESHIHSIVKFPHRQQKERRMQAKAQSANLIKPMIERCANAYGLNMKKKNTEKSACVIVMSTPDIALLINFMICTDRYAFI